MNEKTPIKINLSTFFLVITIIVIIIMGIFLYIEKTNSDKTIAELENSNSDMKNTIDNLQNKIETIATTIGSDTSNDTIQNQATAIPTNVSSSSTSTNLTYSSIKGTYEGTVTDHDETGTVYLTLCENGMYLYEDIIGTSGASQGYYTITDNELTLYQIVRRGNDPGVHIEKTTINLKISSINTITDNKLNTTLKKSSDTVREEVDICNTLKIALDNGFLN